MHVSLIFVCNVIFNTCAETYCPLGQIKFKLEPDLTWNRQLLPLPGPCDYTRTRFRPCLPNAISMAITLSLDWVAGGMLPGLWCQQQETQFTSPLPCSLFSLPLPLKKDTHRDKHRHTRKVASGTSSLNCRKWAEFKRCFRDRWSESVPATVYLTSESEENNMGTVKGTAAWAVCEQRLSLINVTSSSNTAANSPVLKKKKKVSRIYLVIFFNGQVTRKKVRRSIRETELTGDGPKHKHH